MKCRVLEKLARDEVCLGVGLMYPNPNCIEAIGPGWDWLWIDGQHGQFDYATILHAVQVAELTGLDSIVRPPGHAPDLIGQILDTGAQGLMIPIVNTPEQAEAIVKAASFPPLGTRSYGGRRVIDRNGRDYYLTANDKWCLVVQIETMEAVERAHEIAAVEGVDALFFGPDDMKMHMGIPINTPVEQSDKLLQAMETTAAAARNAGKAAGCIAATPAALHRFIDFGYRLIVGGGDIGFLRVTSHAKVRELRQALSRRTG